MRRLSRIHFRRRLFGYLIFLILPLAGFSSDASRIFDFNPRCREGYKAILAFRFEDGRRILLEEKRLQPRNLLPYFLENYIDFFTLFLNEDPLFLSTHEAAWKHRLELMESGPQNSPYYRYTKGLLYFQRATLQAKLGNTWTAGLGFRKAYLLIRDNQIHYPDFTVNELYAGALQVAAGTIPDSYRWLSNLLGITGTLEGGLQQLEQFLAREDVMARLYREEALFIYCYLKFYVQNDREGVSRLINERSWDVRNNHLLAYLAANISLNNQQSARAITFITERNPSPAYFQTPFWDFELGNAKMHHLDPDAAFFLERFVNNFKGDYYLKDALQKISWFYYLQGDFSTAQFYRQQVRQRGRALSEADQQALKDAAKDDWPDPLLLRARLLNDGGYYREALLLLQGKKATDFSPTKHQLEFCYRVGRLYDDMGRKEEAVDFYLNAIRLGENQRVHYAARSTLQLGMIYEGRGDRRSAITWYNRCIGMKGHDFKNAIDQRAKAGLLRCGRT